MVTTRSASKKDGKRPSYDLSAMDKNVGQVSNMKISVDERSYRKRNEGNAIFVLVFFLLFLDKIAN